MIRKLSEVLAEHQQALAALHDQSAVLEAIAEALVGRFRSGGRLYLFGNGGSAADAQHIAAELTGRFRAERQALPAMALTTDTSALTAIANDYDYSRVFARQLEALLARGDAAWGLSTSGRSANVVAGLQVARARGALTIGFTGQAGGPVAELCDHVLKAAHTASDRVQEVHQVAYHFVCERIEAAFLNRQPPGAG